MITITLKNGIILEVNNVLEASQIINGTIKKADRTCKYCKGLIPGDSRSFKMCGKPGCKKKATQGYQKKWLAKKMSLRSVEPEVERAIANEIPY